MRHSFTLLILACSLASYGQFKAINLDAFLNDSAIIFRDITNHIVFKGLKNLSSHSVSIEGAGLTSTYSNTILVSNVKSDTVKISLYKSTDKKRKIVYSRKFSVQNAGEPKVIMKEESYEQPSGSPPFNYIRFEVVHPNSNYTGECKVAHFEININDSQKKVILPPTFISGNYLNPPISDKIASLTVGSKVCFRQIIIKYSNEEYIKYEEFDLEKN